MKIRPATVEDAPGMARVIVDTFLASNRGIMSPEALQRRKQTWTYEVSARNWRRAIEEMTEGDSAICIYVAEDEGGQVVGLSLGCPARDETATAEVGEIDVLYVAESHQRRGIGRALAQTTAAHLAGWGMRKLQICTPVANTQARRFYNKLGGRIIGTRDDYDEGEVIPLVIYEWANIQAFIQAGEAE